MAIENKLIMWTTNIEVSKLIKNLIGNQESQCYFYNPNITNWQFRTDRENLGYDWENNIIVACFTLSELAPVLKKIGEKSNWTMDGWLIHFLKVCELVACNGDANAYLLDLLEHKPN